ncbi:MAG: glutamate-1-semialdehyde-2,1-aminomutase [Bacteroidetes bacterium]|nr:MAG: glutamate-1-semialdehyde-2,1-aminomutase [Bacteroidota bacterium]REK05020.1 MAG: glutamate-1-semialdehyde-2,1-aminomutase [Bacteroidota bacterium]REK36477.1 MAG: glutamate-1-semialdehyde-2,1-aminomutase [Bacteroidota bacterium]REK51691.1 MAG: glutamate-1-semialdehyde-2,1-aminomutase [Bacteroidota bacterium]
MKQEKSNDLYRKALNYFPGGVNSPVRAFRSVGGTPIFIEKGEGCYLTDADGNTYIDFCCSWGPLILGHNHPRVRESIIDSLSNGTSFGAPTAKENELAELILQHNPYIEKIRFVSSGTEAVMSAVRLARGYTGRPIIVKFEGCYHGHVDSLLVKAGSGLSTFGISSSAGIPESVASDTMVLPLNDKRALEVAISDFAHDIAAIIIEPVPANNGLLLQEKSFLEFLRKITADNNIMLIFDEVISGFRLGFTGAAGYYGIQPDIITYGKIIGGGLPVGAYGASAEIMSKIAPDGDVYQAGTLSGNPVAMSAGIAQLRECLNDVLYYELERKTIRFCEKLNGFAEDKSYDFRVFSIASIFWFAFTDKEKIRSSEEIDPESMRHFKKLHKILLENGVYLGPSGYEVGFISAAHTEEVLESAAEKICNALDQVFSELPEGISKV